MIYYANCYRHMDTYATITTESWPSISWIYEPLPRCRSMCHSIGNVTKAELIMIEVEVNFRQKHIINPRKWSSQTSFKLKKSCIEMTAHIRTLPGRRYAHRSVLAGFVLLDPAHKWGKALDQEPPRCDYYETLANYYNFAYCKALSIMNYMHCVM